MVGIITVVVRALISIAECPYLGLDTVDNKCILARVVDEKWIESSE